MTEENIKEMISQKEKELLLVKGTPCEIYSRVVGYFRPVKNWNEGKQEEYKDRVVYETEKGISK